MVLVVFLVVPVKSVAKVNALTRALLQLLQTVEAVESNAVPIKDVVLIPSQMLFHVPLFQL